MERQAKKQKMEEDEKEINVKARNEEVDYFKRFESMGN
jgi:hypothetical protein